MTEPTAFDVLSLLLKPYADEMIVKHDTETNFYLEESISSDKPQMFCAAQVKKNYTSFHVFPVYCHPELLEDVPEELTKRMQGKSCFNFKTADQVPVEALASLVKASRNRLG